MPGRILQHLPELKGEEQVYVARLMKPMDDDEAQQFAAVYRERRKDPLVVLLLTLAGFAGVAGINRFFLDKVGTGLLYLLTGGLCLVGTIFDAVNYKGQTLRYNRRQADEVAAMVRSTPTADDLW